MFRFTIRDVLMAMLFGRNGASIWGFRRPRYSLLTLLILMAVVPPYIALQWHRQNERRKLEEEIEQSHTPSPVLADPFATPE